MPYSSYHEVVSDIPRIIRDASSAALANVRVNCPIQTGDLYNSLSVSQTSDGFVVTASVPYAGIVENGQAAEKFTGTYRTTRKSHTRRSKNGVRSKVREHQVRYEGQRPLPMANGEWRTISSSHVRQGTFFMRDGCIKGIIDTLTRQLTS